MVVVNQSLKLRYKFEGGGRQILSCGPKDLQYGRLLYLPWAEPIWFKFLGIIEDSAQNDITKEIFKKMKNEIYKFFLHIWVAIQFNKISAWKLAWLQEETQVFFQVDV